MPFSWGLDLLGYKNAPRSGKNLEICMDIFRHGDYPLVGYGYEYGLVLVFKKSAASWVG